MKETISGRFEWLGDSWFQCPHCINEFSINQPESGTLEAEELEEAEFWTCPHCERDAYWPDDDESDY